MTLQKFNNDLFSVEAKYIDGEVLFDAESIAVSLGFCTTTEKNGVTYTNVRWSRVNEFLPDVAEKISKGSLIPESLVYMLAFKASNETALKFQMWLSTEVLPSIRKTGSYVSQPTLPTNYKEALVALLGEVEKNEVLALEVQTLQPKAKYTEEVLLSGDALTITQIAKDLGMTGQELNDKLHELKVQYKQGKVWHLYEKYDGLGYTKAHTYNVEGRTPTLTKWTQKGRKFIIDLLKEVE